MRRKKESSKQCTSVIGQWGLLTYTLLGVLALSFCAMLAEMAAQSTLDNLVST